MAEELHLAPSILFDIGPLPVSNTLLLAVATTVVLSAVAYRVSKSLKERPKGFQNFLELVIEGGYAFTESMAHGKGKRFFPLLATFFVFIILSNWSGLLPGMGTIGIDDHGHFKPFLRAATSDLNVTLALATVSIIATHIWSVQILGFGGYLHKWFSLNPIMLYVGLLELVSEFTKIMSLSFRLFGNIFAGEVVLATISGLFAFLAPLPFYMLEVMVGLVQATVFSMLTLVFASIITSKGEH